jgi:hypothetical protein
MTGLGPKAFRESGIDGARPEEGWLRTSSHLPEQAGAVPQLYPMVRSLASLWTTDQAGKQQWSLSETRVSNGVASCVNVVLFCLGSPVGTG